MKKAFFLLLATLVLMFACNEDPDLSPVMVETDFKEMVYLSGQKATFSIILRADKGEIKDFRMKTEDLERGVVSVADTTVSGTFFRKDYVYDMPYLYMKDSTGVKLTMEVTNTVGDNFRITRNFVVVSQDVKPDELTNLTMWTVEDDEHPNAFDITNKRCIYKSLEDSARVDIYFVPDSLNEQTTGMPAILATNTDIRFARSGSFDYGSATERSLKNAFEAAVTAPLIKKVQMNDVILFGRGNKACGVIKIGQAHDEPGYENDYYTLSIKIIK